MEREREREREKRRGRGRERAREREREDREREKERGERADTGHLTTPSHMDINGSINSFLLICP